MLVQRIRDAQSLGPLCALLPRLEDRSVRRAQGVQPAQGPARAGLGKRARCQDGAWKVSAPAVTNKWAHARPRSRIPRPGRSPPGVAARWARTFYAGGCATPARDPAFRGGAAEGAAR